MAQRNQEPPSQVQPAGCLKSQKKNNIVPLMSTWQSVHPHDTHAILSLCAPKSSHHSY